MLENEGEKLRITFSHIIISLRESESNRALSKRSILCSGSFFTFSSLQVYVDCLCPLIRVSYVGLLIGLDSFND
jgi:hypothetical protein